MINNIKRKKIYEGSTKTLFESSDPETMVQHFRDDIIALSGTKKGLITGKGVINNRISESIMIKLANIGIPTHFVKSLNMREQLVRKVEMIPIKLMVRNVAAGKIIKRFSIEEGRVLPRAIIEYYLRTDQSTDPILAEDHIIAFGWASQFEIEDIRSIAIRINDFLTGLFMGVGLRLIDFKIEFGRTVTNDLEHVVIADEISPDNFRVWDINTNEKLDKDRFRYDMGGVKEAYCLIAKKLGLLYSDDDLNQNDDTL